MVEVRVAVPVAVEVGVAVLAMPIVKVVMMRVFSGWMSLSVAVI